MSTATDIQLERPAVLIEAKKGPVSEADALLEEAIHLACICRTSLATLDGIKHLVDPSRAYTADEVLALPLTEYRAPDELYNLPRRRSARHALAVLLAPLLYPVEEGSLTAIIRYDADRVRLRAWAALQRKYDLLQATKQNGRSTMDMADGAGPGVRAPVWASRIIRQGEWDPVKTSVSVDGVPGIPMPVKVSQRDQLEPFFRHLRANGTHEVNGGQEAQGGKELDGGKGEPYYQVRGAEFRKGVVYEDGRMDLCKMVVGPDHIWSLVQSLRGNQFVRHFLLGNNIIGQSGARAIATFINELPERMETWYLAGNCIDGAGFKEIVDAMVASPAVTNVWMKRNPLGPASAHDIYRLVTTTPNLRTLDLDQTELGDSGVADLFTQLAAYSGPDGSVLPLRHVYLNGCGISIRGAAAIGSFLANPHCALSSLYLSCNPLGNGGVEALATALPKAPYLARLSFQSVGVGTQGVVALCKAVSKHNSVRCVDLGQAFATEDLQQAYNYIQDGAVPALCGLLKTSQQLEYLNLGHSAITNVSLSDISSAILQSPSLLYYSASSIVPDPTRKAATFIPSRDLHFPDPASPLHAEIMADKAVRQHLETNVKAKYGPDMSYVEFRQGEKRWLMNDKEDVRKIDSVYRNRDAGMARRGLITLVKQWDGADDTLAQIKMAEVPELSAAVAA
ncbi:hypothetical protein QQS21_006714 [Conoideocrella luteorostrata]|uniref:RNI-like protein n=1 Tax=Conoideocrella luteorostrata TaxID=1105319 RepID=A0AAJ0CME7_9HYPO|nr:hypothetical protein QQS21_006714 [Conoideocrella luteorostrata]